MIVRRLDGQWSINILIADMQLFPLGCQNVLTVSVPCSSPSSSNEAAKKKKSCWRFHLVACAVLLGYSLWVWLSLRSKLSSFFFFKPSWRFCRDACSLQSWRCVTWFLIILLFISFFLKDNSTEMNLPWIHHRVISFRYFSLFENIRKHG